MYHNIASLIAFLTGNDNVIVFCVRETVKQAEQAVLDAPRFPALLREFSRTSISIDAGSTLDGVVQRFNEQSGAGPQVIYSSDPIKLSEIADAVGNALIRTWEGQVEFEGFSCGDSAFLLQSGDLLVARVFGNLIFERVQVLPYVAPAETNELGDLARTNSENDERIEHEV